MAIDQMPLAYFSKTNNCDVTNMCDIVRATWPQTMCPHISKNILKPQRAKSSGTKKSCKNSYTIFEEPSDERRGECIRTKINASLSKTRSISRWKSSTNRKRSTLANGWRWWKDVMVLTMGPHEWWGLMHTLRKHIPLHEQVLECNAIVLMEVE